jgi:Viral BACON domain/Putative binding domain, N-terminal
MLGRLTRFTVILLALMVGHSCSDGNLTDSGAAPTAIPDPVANPPKQGARHYQGTAGSGINLDMSVFLRLLGAGSGSAALTATNAGADGPVHAVAVTVYEVTGSFTTSNGVQGTVQGRLQGTPDSGLFDGSLKVLGACEAERKYAGPLTNEAIDWTAGAIVKDCPGNPLTFDISLPASSAPPCSYVVTSTTTSFAAAGGNGTATVSTPSACSWTAQSSVDWIVFSGGSSHSGSGNVAFTVQANTGANARQGTLSIAGQQLTVTQQGVHSCSFDVSPKSLTFQASGEDRTVDVKTPATCQWTIESLPSWLTLDGRSTRTGNGVVTLRARANTSTATRKDTIRVAGQEIGVTQEGAAPPCEYEVAPSTASFAAAGGDGLATVTTTAACEWTATSDVGWITITPGSHTGNGTLNYHVAANITASPRQGHITVQGQTINVSQELGTLLHVEIVGTGTVAVKLPASQPVGEPAITVCAGPGGTTCDYSIDANTSVVLFLGDAGAAFVPVAWEAPAGCTAVDPNTQTCQFVTQPGLNLVRVRVEAPSLLTLHLQVAAGYQLTPSVTFAVGNARPLFLCSRTPDLDVATESTCPVVLDLTHSATVTLSADHYQFASICWTGCTPNSANHWQKCSLNLNPGVSAEVTLRLGFTSLPPECQGGGGVPPPPPGITNLKR